MASPSGRISSPFSIVQPLGSLVLASTEVEPGQIASQDATDDTASGTWSEEEIRENIGQLFIVGFHGHVANEDIKTLVSTHKVGTVILFERNIQSPTQINTLTQTLQEIAAEAGHYQPLFIGIDQENGLVSRIKEPLAVQLPGSMALAATGNLENARRVAMETAEMLKSHGINFNYAPVADVNSEPKNPVIGVRSPSNDPEVTGRFVSAQIKGLIEKGVVPCIKHFPGHGDTIVDSHLGLPVVNKTRAQLDACELIPFRRAILEGVDSVMVGHIALPNVTQGNDEQLPASLNPEVIRILREDLGHDGLIITDCLEMNGVRTKYGTAQSAVMALKAGTDCVMICHTIGAQIQAIELVIKAVKSGELSQDEIRKSVERVRELKTKYLPNQKATAPLDSMGILERHTSVVSETYAASTTVIRRDNFFPISEKLRKVVLITPGKTSSGGGIIEKVEDQESLVTITYASLIEEIDPGYLEVIEIEFFEDTPLSEESWVVIEQAKAVILATRNATLNPYQRDLGLLLGRKLAAKRLIVIATCDPYDFLEDADVIKNYIAIYEPTLSAFKAAVDIIFGKRKATGVLPIGPQRSQYEPQVLSNPTQEEIQRFYSLWNSVFMVWPIDIARFTKLLQHDHGRYIIHEKGFCFAYLFDDGMAKIAAIGVVPGFRHRGLGTALVTKAREELNKLGEAKSFGIGSVFPRFWPGVPFDMAQEYKDFFLHRGFRKSTKPTARDLYRDITVEKISPDIVQEISKLPLRFSPWSPELYDECMTKQVDNFGHNKVWVEAYRNLAASNQHHEVMVAFSTDTGEQVGWTLMCSSTSSFADDVAFLPLCPSGNETGLIACVGVDRKARGKSVGKALLVRAMEDLRRRGMKGVFIDWVVIRGFYETLGFEPIWEYDAYDW